MKLMTKKLMKPCKASAMLIVALTLTGCTSLEVVAFIGSSVTYAVSGKSWTDHAVSAVTQQDCVMHRIIQGSVACVPVNEPDKPSATHNETSIAEIAEVDARQNTELLIDKGINHDSETQIVKISSNTESLLLQKPKGITPRTPSVESTSKVSTENAVNSVLESEESKLQFAVLGSYTNPQFAAKQLQRYAEFDASLTQISANGTTRFRIIVGPLANADDYQSLQQALPELAAQMWLTEVSNQQRQQDIVLLEPVYSLALAQVR